MVFNTVHDAVHYVEYMIHDNHGKVMHYTMLSGMKFSLQPQI